MKSKVEIVTGFLGSGKTSFIKSYINTFNEEDKPYIIYLEKGNNNLENYKRASYVRTLEELEDIFEKDEVINSKNILIEHNGTIELKKISDILLKNKIKKRINFYGVYFVGNYKNLNSVIRNIGEIIIPFIQSSKLLILTNYKNVKDEERYKVLDIIKEINLKGQIIEVSSLDNIEEEIKRSKYFKNFAINKFIKGIIKGDKNGN